MKITKKHAIIGIAVIILIGVGFFFLGGVQSEDSSAGVKTEKSAEIVKDAADDVDKAMDKDTNKSEKAEKNESADKKSNATSEKSSNKNNSNSGNKNNSNSSNSGSSSNSNSGSSNNTPSKPTHTHSWTAVYKTVTETEYVGTRSICSTCGADVTGKTASHAEQHMLNGENGGHYSKPIYEEVTKSVYSHDKCSCGATK